MNTNREYIGKAVDHPTAEHFKQCCRAWFSPEAANLLDVEQDGCVYSRIAEAVGRNSGLQLNALVASRFDAFMAGFFCGKQHNGGGANG